MEYSIEIYEGELEEKKIEEFLNTRINKRAILKSVLVDELNETTESKSINESSYSNKVSNYNKNNKSLCIKIYFNFKLIKK